MTNNTTNIAVQTKKTISLQTNLNNYIVTLLKKQNALLQEVLEILDKKEADEKQKYLKVKDVAEILKMSPSRIRRLVKQKKLIGVKLGESPKSHILITQESINTLVTSSLTT
ncbi:helix-turn-helix domain-containing protein [Candidatus Uabimicrobium sp. HlEnr_7]|uniref:helix-turn-helix domain-containing protein n=1 Tax=Candidatus Uabimicrobium helgolandensis TaxID=3095367 RepID=UPI0035561D18